MSRPQIFSVTAIEHFEADKDGNIKDPIKHHWCKDMIGLDSGEIETLVRHKLTVKLKFTAAKDIMAFSKRLKVNVTCPFPA